MPSKKKKYNARFPAGRIKKIMQSDEEIGKVAQAVPVIISRTLELFVESLLTKTVKITNSRNAKTLSTSHMKQCIMSEQRFDFLRELVKNIPDISVAEEAANYNDEDAQSSPEEVYPDSDTPYDLSMPSTSMRATYATQAHTSASAPLSAYYNGAHAGRQHLRRGTSSVIMHTAAVINSSFNNIDIGSSNNSDCQPARYVRSDSSPVNVAAHTAMRQRLKHQSQSLPIHISSNSNNNSNNITDCSPPKRSRVESSTATHAHMPTQSKQLPQTAIPAPIVSFDFCNKPIVKIDYSNLPMPATSVTASAAPHSAPANIATAHSAHTAFNFSAEPVISIDLSNIVTNAAAATAAATAVHAPASNGTTIIAAPALGAPNPAASYVSATTACSSISNNNTQNSKATMAAPFNPNPTIHISPTAPVTMTVKLPMPAKPAAANKLFFELDEDYDNI